ncbi:HalOD1 output domain-containing protein [Haladaptatus salinisoli]|uniref:HalOD1 output domain-containing protein n=1 Tax=Haladaptatus salinisoli TaxID=2884876 RepID=UPI001D0B8E8B|nr:HalOD1 output domain-containing protein [Haladaptatus salinisoli]
MPSSSDLKAKASIHTTSTGTESITSTVVMAVTEANGTKPATPLYEAIDPDALEALYQHGSPEVRFEYIGYSITIHPDRTISVTEIGA